jgi:hypothetical protein
MKKLIKKLLREGYNHVSLDYVKNKKPKLDRYKNFKQKNIGDFVLISDMYSEDEIKRFGLLGQILVFDKNDNTEIGNSSFGFNEEGILKASIDVRPDFRRKGVGTQMYLYIEELTGLKITPSPKHSSDAEKFWNQSNRPFGLDEAISDPTFNENFNRWFDGSKVVDEAGKPLICYHGSSKNITTFNTKRSAQGVFWFTTDKNKILSGESGAAATNKIIPVFISAKKIAGWDEYEKLGLGQIEDMGYDAIKLDNDYIVFDPRKIKSIKNKGDWGINNKNIFK